MKREIQEEILSHIDHDREWNDDIIWQMIDDTINQKGRECYINPTVRLELRQQIFNAIRRLDILQELVDDHEITEIMVNGEGQIFYEKYGYIREWDKRFESREKLEDIIQQIVARSNRYVNESSPIVDTRLPDGSRVNIVLSPIAVDGPVMTIRKFSRKPITMEQMIEWEGISREAVDLLNKLVRAGYNMIISGSTGSGKTTMLNALTNFIPRDERIITIEDSAELQIQGIKNLVRLEARNANTEGANEISIRDLIKSSLRMRPDRIVIGEVRGPEAIDLLMAMNTGHDGSISTAHANSVRDLISRLETMILMGMDIPLAAVRKQIASSIDIIVQLGRLRDKSRRVIEIAEVGDYIDGEIILNPLFSFSEDPISPLVREKENYGEGNMKVYGSLKSTGNHLYNQAKLQSAAIEL